MGGGELPTAVPDDHLLLSADSPGYPLPSPTESRSGQTTHKASKMARKIATLLPAVIFFVGCGGAEDSNRPATVPTSGVVTYKGAKLADATVTFNPEAPDGQPAFGRTDAEGRFELTTFEAGDGAVAGKYIVTVTKFDAPPPTAPAATSEADYVPPEDNPGAKQAAPKSLVPKKYAAMHTTDLRAEVSEGNEKPFEFALND